MMADKEIKDLKASSPQKEQSAEMTSLTEIEMPALPELNRMVRPPLEKMVLNVTAYSFDSGATPGFKVPRMPAAAFPDRDLPE